MNNIMYRFISKAINWYHDAHDRQVKEALLHCGQRVSISPEAIIWGTAGVVIEDDVVINSYTHIFGSGGVHIGARTMISTLCSITSTTHPKEINHRREQLGKPVIIEEDCWIGTGAIILPGVTLGKGTIVAAGAVVTRNTPPMAMVSGIPAKVTSYLSHTNEPPSL